MNEKSLDTDLDVQFLPQSQNAAHQLHNATPQLHNAKALGVLLDEHRAADTVVLDLRQMNTWTDFFVIATASSSTHLEGLERHIKEFICGHDMEIIRRSPRPSARHENMGAARYGNRGAARYENGGAGQDDEWMILDLGTIVVHLMSAKARSFYELERLYPPPQACIIYSSKSS